MGDADAAGEPPRAVIEARSTSSRWKTHPRPREAADGGRASEYYLNEQVEAIQKELGDERQALLDLEEWKKHHRPPDASPGRRRGRRPRASSQLVMSPDVPPRRRWCATFIDTLTSLPVGNQARSAGPWHTPSRCSTRPLRLEVKGNASSNTSRSAARGRLKRPSVPGRPPGCGQAAGAVGQNRPDKFIRMSLGGVRDEADPRASPHLTSARCRVCAAAAHQGRYRATGRSCSTRPTSWAWIRGTEPALPGGVSTPEQNHTFGDHYVEVDLT